jgi:hypothetical protein
MARPLIKRGAEGDDVLDAQLRLNLSGADPQLPASASFDQAMEEATKAFQRAHGLQDDGQIGNNTWALLDQLDGGRLMAAAGIAGINATHESARLLLDGGDFATAKSLLDAAYAEAGLPPELRSRIAAGLSWAEHGLGNWERARDLLVEASLVAGLFSAVLTQRDFIHRMREITLRQPPGPIPSRENERLLPG